MHFKDCSICMLWQNKWFHAIHLPERGKASHAVQFINFWWPTSSSYPISSSSFSMSSSSNPLSASSYLAPHCKLLIGCNYLAFPYKTFPKVDYIPQENIISPNHIHASCLRSFLSILQTDFLVITFIFFLCCVFIKLKMFIKIHLVFA